MRKKSIYLCPVVFCLFLFATAAVLVMGKSDNYSDHEKRYLQSIEPITWAGILDGTVRHNVEGWIEDQFPARDSYVAINSYWMLLTGRNSLQENYYSDHGYLIGAPNASDLVQFEKNLKRFDSFASACNVPVSMVMVPTTGWLHKEHLPISAKDYLDDDCFAAAAQLNNISFLDLREQLKTADLEQPVCYKTDHHLTAWGNYTLYRAWCEHNNLRARDMLDYAIKKTDGFYGTTWSGSGYWLTDADTIELWDNQCETVVTILEAGKTPVTSNSMFFEEHLSNMDKYPVYLDGNHTQVQIETPSADGKTLLVIKDSYAQCFTTFLAEHYSKVIMLDLRYYRGSVSDFMIENQVDEVLFFYGVSTLLTDTNSAWLF